MKIVNLLTAIDFAAPTVPEEAERYFPDETESFGSGLLQIIKKAIEYMNPSIADAAGICASIIGIILLIAVLNTLSDSTQHIHRLIGTVAIGLLLVQPSNTLVDLGIKTVEKMSDYGKLLLPVMTASLAAEGGMTSSAALYTGTTIFNMVLMSILSHLIVPFIYAYMAVSIANCALKNDFLSEISKFIKWLMTWVLKLVLYVFSGYIGITGVVSGTADAAAVKATKLAITGTVPVVGSILSDASETILVSAGLVKNTAGIFGLLSILSIWIGPFIHIGIQYILLKTTGGLCGIFGEKGTSMLVKDFSTVMGFLLAVIGAMCLLLLISTVCFLRGING